MQQEIYIYTITIQIFCFTHLLIICTSISLLLKPRAESSKSAGLPAGTNLMESPITDIFGAGMMPTRHGDPNNL